MKNRMLFAACVLIMNSIGSGHAETYDYYGKANFKLGSGFRKLNPSQPPAPCLVVSPQTIQTDDTVGQFQLKINLVKDRQQLYSLLHIDAHLAGRTLAANANVDTAFDKETSMESDDLTWILYAYQEYGSQSINPIFITDAKALKSTPAKLIQRCGQEYVQSVKRATQIAAVFTLHNLNQSTKTSLEVRFGGGASWTGGDVTFSGNYKSFLSEASQHGTIEVKVFGFGGGGIARLSDIVLKGDNFDNVRAALAGYLRTDMGAERAAPISFTTSSFGDLTDPPISISPVGDPPQLDSIYLEYGNTLSRIRRIEEMLSGTNGRFGYVSNQQLQMLKKIRQGLADHLSILQDQAYQCNQPKSTCKFADIDTDVIEWPKSPDENCSKWKNATCNECQVPIRFLGELTGKKFTFACTHMPNNASVHVKFENLYITINDSEPDNKVWNTWIIASVQGLSICTTCTVSRVSPGLGAGGPPNSEQLDRHWKLFDFEGNTKADSGVAHVQLTIDKCQAGPRLTTCDSSPPGTGTNHTLDGVSNRGFPVPYPPPGASIVFTVTE